MQFAIVASLFMLGASARPSPYSFSSHIQTYTTGIEKVVAAKVMEQDLLGIKGKLHDKRNSIIYKALKAVIHYDCPSTGPRTHTIRWQVSFDFVEAHLDIKPLEGLDRFSRDEVKLSENNFSAIARHYHCDREGERSCKYYFKALIDGSVFSHDWSISMEIVQNARDVRDNPIITEWCEYPGRTHITNNCSTSSSGGTGHSAKCPISLINVYNDPGHHP